MYTNKTLTMMVLITTITIAIAVGELTVDTAANNDCFVLHDQVRGQLKVHTLYTVPILSIVLGMLWAAGFAWYVATKQTALTECQWIGKNPLKLMTDALEQYKSTEPPKDLTNFYTLEDYIFTKDKKVSYQNVNTIIKAIAEEITEEITEEKETKFAAVIEEITQEEQTELDVERVDIEGKKILQSNEQANKKLIDYSCMLHPKTNKVKMQIKKFCTEQDKVETGGIKNEQHKELCKNFIVPISMPYLFRRLQLQWGYTLTIIVWVSISTLVTTHVLIINCRGYGYWERIAIATVGANVLHIVIIVGTSYVLFRRLVASTLLRGVYEVMCRSGMFKVSGSYKNLAKYSRFPVSTFSVQQKTSDGTTSYLPTRSYGRPIYYLDNIESSDVHWCWMTSQERTLFTESTKLANAARKEIMHNQNRLLASAGSAAIAAIITVITAMEQIDDKGTAPALYALASTFNITALAQTIGAYIGLTGAAAKNTAATKGIIAINRDEYSNLHKWAKKMATRFSPWYVVDILRIKEKPFSEEEILQNPYRKNEVYGPDKYVRAILSVRTANILRAMAE